MAPDSAETAEDLWQVLLRSRPSGDPVPMLAASLLTKHHGQGEPGALVTALLLCTCRRWERCTGALIKDIVDEGVLSEEDLARLARLFLSGDTIRFRKVGGPWHRAAAGPHAIASMGHRLSTPLPAGELLLAPRSGTFVKGVMAAAAVSGMLDSIGALGPDEAALLLDIGLVWPLGSVRRHALEILAAQGDVEEAARLAAADPDAKVRRWRRRDSASAAADSGKDGGLQDSLFDGPLA